MSIRSKALMALLKFSTNVKNKYLKITYTDIDINGNHVKSLIHTFKKQF